MFSKQSKKANKVSKKQSDDDEDDASVDLNEDSDDGDVHDDGEGSEEGGIDYLDLLTQGADGMIITTMMVVHSVLVVCIHACSLQII
jgi:hypothetical protein